MSRGILIFLVVVLLIFAILGTVVGIGGGQKNEGFAAPPTYTFKDNCSVYYTDDPDMQKACDEGEFEHPPVYYDIKMSQDPNNAQKWQNIKTAQSNSTMPNLPGDNTAKKVCKVTLPGWKQYYDRGDGNAVPPALVPPLPGSTKGAVSNWAHCVYEAPNIETINKMANFNNSYRGSAMTLDKDPQTGSIKGISMNGSNYFKMVLNSLELPDISGVYCQSPGGRKRDPYGQLIESNPFKTGMVLTVDGTQKVKKVEYMLDGRIISWAAAGALVIMGANFSELITEITKNRIVYENLFKIPKSTNYNIVLANRDVCGIYEQKPIGSIAFKLTNPILVKQVEKAHDHLLGNTEQLTENERLLNAREVVLVGQINLRTTQNVANNTLLQEKIRIRDAAQGRLNIANTLIGNLEREIGAIMAMITPGTPSVLAAGRALFSDSNNTLVRGNTRFVLGTDGSLKIFNNNIMKWQRPPPGGRPPYMLTMETGGLLILKDDNDAVLWQNGRGGCPSPKLQLEAGYDNLGDMLLYCNSAGSGSGIEGFVVERFSDSEKINVPRPAMPNVRGVTWISGNPGTYPWNAYYRFKQRATDNVNGYHSVPTRVFGPISNGTDRSPIIEIQISQVPGYTIIVEKAYSTTGPPPDSAYVNLNVPGGLRFLDSLAPNPPPPVPRGITVYRWCDYRHDGAGIRLPIGNYTLSELINRGVQNNDLRSIRVDAGITAKLYDGHSFDGWELKTRADMNCFPQQYSDKVSSLKVMETANDPGLGVTLYQHCDYSGYAIRLPVGEYNMGDLQARGVRNDDVSSIRVDQGITAKLYQDAGFAGRMLPTTSDISCLVNNSFNDQLSSLKVIETANDRTPLAKVINGWEGENASLTCALPRRIAGGNTRYYSGWNSRQRAIPGDANGQPAYTYNINNNSMGGDPRYGVRKNFTTNYTCA